MINYFQYNGKELDRMHGLDWYDYGARHYDAVLGRWMCMDPLVEKTFPVSGYIYCLNNPIKFIDPNGDKAMIWYVDKNGKNRTFMYDGTQKRVPNNAFVLDFVHTYNYLKGKEAGENLCKAVTDPNIIIEVQESSEENLYDNSDRRYTVFWMPRKGLRTSDGGKQSPAVRLEHEFDHALDDIKNHKEHREKREVRDSQYDNAEEKRVIRGSETKTARKLGESIRTNHRGTDYDVVDPRTTVPLNK
uniref:RHS repeat-associated core domain-containing protein n=1 Tax=Prevotella sp. GTC17253 TaxID=3236793 RepID=A0AB33IXV5_9BACT